MLPANSAKRNLFQFRIETLAKYHRLDTHIIYGVIRTMLTLFQLKIREYQKSNTSQLCCNLFKCKNFSHPVEMWKLHCVFTG